MEIGEGQTVMMFYNSFSLDLERLSAAISATSKGLAHSAPSLANAMNVNSPIGRSYIGWLKHTFLARSIGDNLTLTLIGELIHKYDPFLTDLGTQWLLHYYLTTEHEERSEAWYQLFNHFLPLYSTFEQRQFSAFFAETVGSSAGNRKAVEKDPVTAVRLYVRGDGLRNLQLLQETGKGIYTISEHIRYPHILLVGAMLLEGWQRHFGNARTVPFSRLYNEPGSLGRVMLAPTYQVKEWVVELSARKLLNFSESQHEPVNRLTDDSVTTLIEKYYRER